MTPRPPASDVRIGPGSVPGEPQEPVYGHVCRCGNPAAHWHHIVSRSKLSGPFSVVMIDGLNWGNLVALCFSCHDRVEHVGRREDWADIVLPEKDSDLPYMFLWYDYETGDFSPLGGVPRSGSSPLSGKRRAASAAVPLSSERAAPLPSAASLPEPPAHELGATVVGAVAPGSTCPTCNRRVNHTKKDTSPVSTTISQRLPVDEKDGMKQLIADTATTIGADSLKYPQAKTVEVGMILIQRYHSEALEIVQEMAA